MLSVSMSGLGVKIKSVFGLQATHLPGEAKYTAFFSPAIKHNLSATAYSSVL